MAEVASSCGKATGGEGGAGGGSGGVRASNWPLARVNIAQAPIKTIAVAAALLCAGVGTVGIEASGAVGVEGDGDTAKRFVSGASGNLTVSPVLPRVQAEFIVNLIEVSVKPPEEK